MNWFKEKYEQYVIKKYIQAGAEYGEALSYSHMGKCVGFDLLRFEFSKWERKIKDIGYKPYTMNQFVAYGAFGQNLPEIKKRRKK